MGSKILNDYFENEKNNFSLNPQKKQINYWMLGNIIIQIKSLSIKLKTALMQVIHTMYNMEEAIVKG